MLASSKLLQPLVLLQMSPTVLTPTYNLLPSLIIMMVGVFLVLAPQVNVLFTQTGYSRMA